ncbi:MAG: hypothetical protein KAG10_09150, partial [Methylococcales bacterium]|nr:hypothetical protein [Methylococcales bacterium]
MKKNLLLFIITLFSIITPLHAEDGTYATTEDGQGVILYSNGTWAFKSTPPPSKSKKTSTLKDKTSEADIPKVAFR